MFKKFSTTTLVLLFIFPIFAHPQARSNGAEIASLKFTLTNFRNSSVLRSRFGLLRFSPDGHYLAAVGTTRDVVLYDANTGQILSTIDNGNLGFAAFSFSPDSKEIAVQDAAYDKILLFAADSGKLIREIDSTGKIASARKAVVDNFRNVDGLEMPEVPITHDWKNAFVNSRDGQYQMIDVGSGAVKQIIEHAPKQSKLKNFFTILVFPYSIFLPSDTQISSDGKFLLVSTGNKVPTLWSAETGMPIASLRGHESSVLSSAFSPDGQLVATSEFKGITKIWKTYNGELVTTFGSKKQKAYFGGWSPDGSRVITRQFKRDALVWDTGTGKFLFKLDKSEGWGFLFDADGKQIISYGQSNKDVSVQFWDAESGRLVSSIPREKSEDRAFSVGWSPDRRYFVTASTQFVKIWDADRKLIQQLDNAVFPARFSPDGKTLATGGKSDTGLIWGIK